MVHVHGDKIKVNQKMSDSLIENLDNAWIRSINCIQHLVFVSFDTKSTQQSVSRIISVIFTNYYLLKQETKQNKKQYSCKPSGQHHFKYHKELVKKTCKN